MSQLMPFFEMEERYQKKEDPFDLTIEKLMGIRGLFNSASTRSDFKALLDAAAIPIPFCYEYQRVPVGNHLCPRHGREIFEGDEGDSGLRLAGDRRPKDRISRGSMTP